MIKRQLTLAFSLLTLSLAVHAGDMGFRFNGTGCVDKTGKAGLNPSFFGQCGDLRHLTISGYSLDTIDLSGSVFDASDFEGTSFNGANLTGASFNATNLSGVSMLSATLHGTNFTNAQMRNTHLAGADIKYSNFTNVDFTGEVFSTMSFSGSTFTSTILTGAALDSADLSGCDLTSANLTHANLQSATLDSATLNKTIFTGADLTKASLQKVNGSAVHFAGTILRQSNLKGATLVSADMRGAQMDQSSLVNGSFEVADLRHAVLKDAVLTGADFKGARINRSTVLPIPMDQALKMGMYLDTTTHLLMIYDANDQYLGPFLGGIGQLGVEVTVSPKDTTTFDGSVDLGDYTAILHVNSNSYNVDMPATGQAALVKFVQGGGTFISTGGILYSQSQLTFFQQMADLILFTYTTQSAAALQLTTAAGMSAHPVLNGIAASSTVPSMSYVTSTLKAFTANPSTLLMSDSQNDPIVAVRDFGSGHVVGLAFCNANGPDCLAGQTFQQLVTNATNWQ